MCGMRSDLQARFLCDQNLGKLAKWLRILGFDAEYMSHWDEDLVRQAVENGRIVLTRKRSIAAHKSVVFIAHDHVREQLQELFGALDLRQGAEPFTRCSLCNTFLVDTNREEVHAHIPEYVYTTHEIFARCPSCGRIYWKGTHSKRIDDMIHSFLKD